jgi:ankyrin repeat protein
MGSWLTPLHMAVKGNSVAAAKLLVERGADLGERGFQDAFKGE